MTSMRFEQRGQTRRARCRCSISFGFRSGSPPSNAKRLVMQSVIPRLIFGPGVIRRWHWAGEPGYCCSGCTAGMNFQLCGEMVFQCGKINHRQITFSNPCFLQAGLQEIRHGALISRRIDVFVFQTECARSTATFMQANLARQNISYLPRPSKFHPSPRLAGCRDRRRSNCRRNSTSELSHAACRADCGIRASTRRHSAAWGRSSLSLTAASRSRS